ncbi:hypothetical protein HMPREF9999_01561 [Alloprevotella sp. oral taxon 473 str. F0040]|nr:hypothetical protein HMPREF9999_01561 [Alloprevotella sp. oral taxon 473 str. F0040]
MSSWSFAVSSCRSPLGLRELKLRVAYVIAVSYIVAARLGCVN